MYIYTHNTYLLRRPAFVGRKGESNQQGEHQEGH